MKLGVLQFTVGTTAVSDVTQYAVNARPLSLYRSLAPSPKPNTTN